MGNVTAAWIMFIGFWRAVNASEHIKVIGRFTKCLTLSPVYGLGNKTLVKVKENLNLFQLNIIKASLTQSKQRW